MSGLAAGTNDFTPTITAARAQRRGPRAEGRGRVFFGTPITPRHTPAHPLAHSSLRRSCTRFFLCRCHTRCSPQCETRGPAGPAGPDPTFCVQLKRRRAALKGQGLPAAGCARLVPASCPPARKMMVLPSMTSARRRE